MLIATLRISHTSVAPDRTRSSSFSISKDVPFISQREPLDVAQVKDQIVERWQVHARIVDRNGFPSGPHRVMLKRTTIDRRQRTGNDDVHTFIVLECVSTVPTGFVRCSRREEFELYSYRIERGDIVDGEPEVVVRREHR